MSNTELSITDQLAAIKERGAELARDRERSKPASERPRVSLGYALASSIAPSKPEWLWHGWLLARSVNLLVGRQGAGKTTFASHLLAALVNGNALHGDDRRPPMRAGILSLEEPKDRVVARLKAAGANLDRIVVLSDVEEVGEEGYISRRPWRLPQDVSILGERIIDQDLQIVIVDGLGYSIAGDSHNYAVVGAALSALSAEADRTGAAILGLVHPPKGASDAVTSAIGSTAWTAIPRIVMVLGIDPSDETRKRIAVNVAKTNYKLPDRGLHFEIHNNDEFECGFVALMAESDVTADAITASPPSEDDRSEQAEMATILLELTEDGPVAVDEARRALRQAGYTPSDSTLTRVRQRAGLITGKPTGFGGRRSFMRSEQAGTVCSPPYSPVSDRTSDRTGVSRDLAPFSLSPPITVGVTGLDDLTLSEVENTLAPCVDYDQWSSLVERVTTLPEDSPALAWIVSEGYLDRSDLSLDEFADLLAKLDLEESDAHV